MSKWTRWQDWAALVTGVVVFEVVTALVALEALAVPDVIALPSDATCAGARASRYRRQHTTAGQDRGVPWI